MKTELIEQTYQGKQIFAIYEVKSVNGRELVSERPIVSFGPKKAAAILQNISKLQEYAEQNPYNG